MMYQSIKVSYPKSHGTGPMNLAFLVKKPSAPKKYNIKSFKDVIKNARNNTEYDKE
ncbi:MAG: hypothetical protein J6S85_03915 [Methanobrevibacter sp.]|nr:hypothetical protein [Methanobrevibacter sp.]MBO7712689.1 hypothetical protein [Methanobrevibacter sp.]